MTAIEILEAYRYIPRQLERINEMMARNRSSIEACTAKLSAEAGGVGLNDRFNDFVCKQEEYEIMLLDLLEQETALFIECNKILNHLAPTEKEMMRLYYIDRLKWREVAKCLNYDERHCRRLKERIHGKMSAFVR